jgi:hypothetical protein
MSFARLLRVSLLWSTLSLALWWLQPASSEGISGPRGLLFWSLHVAILLPTLYGAQAVVLWFPFQPRLFPVISLALSGVVGSVAFAPVALVLDALFAATNDAADNGSVLNRALSEFLSLVVPVTLVWILINTRQLARLSVPRLNAVAEQDVPTLSSVEAELWSLVPSALGHDLIALSAEQHYVRVYTTKGDTLILFGFRRAVAAVERFDGLRIHRSHWVRLTRVVDVSGTSRDLRCRLSNGLVLPVSRGNVAVLRQRLDKRRHAAIVQMSSAGASGRTHASS